MNEWQGEYSHVEATRTPLPAAWLPQAAPSAREEVARELDTHVTAGANFGVLWTAAEEGR